MSLGRSMADMDAERDRKAAEVALGNQNSQNLSNLFSNETSPFTVTGGTLNEQKGRIEGLQRAKMLTGQNPYEIGQSYQEAMGNIKKRTTLSDTGSELLRANKAGAVADARNQLQAQGVKGGAALNAVAQVERAKAYDVNNQLAQSQRQAEQDYMNATKANANFTQASEMNFGSMAAGRDVKAPSSNSGGFDTVICTELHRQGYFSSEIMVADRAYGEKLRTERPEVYIGYRLWADKLVPLMQKSEGWTKAVAFFALPWAKNMAGEKNLFGKIISTVGEPICGIIGRTILLGEKYVVCKAK